MTVVGKILVFLNLVFSVVIGGFVVAAYVARANWVHQFKELENQNKVLVASEATYRTEITKVQQKANDDVAAAQVLVKKLTDDLNIEKTAHAQAVADLENLKKTGVRKDALASLSSIEVDKRQADVAQLRDSLRRETEANNALAKRNADLTEQATMATIERSAALARAKGLEEQVQQMERDMAKVRASGGNAAVAKNGKNPPPENVEGLVKATDPGGLMTITIGSDAGLAPGHTLELFRLGKSPKYLGTVKIVEAGHRESVAQVVGKLSGTPQRGDTVASRIMGR